MLVQSPAGYSLAEPVIQTPPSLPLNTTCGLLVRVHRPRGAQHLQSMLVSSSVDATIRVRFLHAAPYWHWSKTVALACGPLSNLTKKGKCHKRLAAGFSTVKGML